MRTLPLILLFCAFCFSAVFAWDKEDHEIFDIVAELEKHHGKGTSFYSFLNVSPTGSEEDIRKAYKRKMLTLHPDKRPNNATNDAIVARAGVINKILRDPAMRKRYDYFYKNGVPYWRGGAYMYSRFRPGFGTVVVFLVLLTSGLQYLVQRINYRAHLALLGSIKKRARAAAWGPKGVPGAGRKKVRVPRSAPVAGAPEFDEDGEPLQRGRGPMLELMVEGEEVFWIEPDNSHTSLNADDYPVPGLTRTWPFALVRALVRRVLPDGKAAAAEEAEESEGTSADESAKTSGRGRAQLAGGRRRKAPTGRGKR